MQWENFGERCTNLYAFLQLPMKRSGVGRGREGRKGKGKGKRRRKRKRKEGKEKRGGEGRRGKGIKNNYRSQALWMTFPTQIFTALIIIQSHGRFQQESILFPLAWETLNTMKPCQLSFRLQNLLQLHLLKQQQVWICFYPIIFTTIADATTIANPNTWDTFLRTYFILK